ncbi:MAG: hypothetical protein R2822_29965 [Spirosomataceae bacterium]
MIYFLDDFLELDFETVCTSSTGIDSTTATGSLTASSLGGSTRGRP